MARTGRDGGIAGDGAARKTPAVAPAGLFAPGRIGGLRVANRLVRSGVAEAMASPEGLVTERLLDLYGDLARGGVGLVVTGHLFVHPRGQCAPNQMGIAGDATVPGLRALTGRVHEHGGRIFAQLSHAGGQSRMPATALTPSGVPNPMTGVRGRPASAAEVDEVLEAFAAAAERARLAGFDGVHIHGASGYLLSEFASPLTNRRTDRWAARAGTSAFGEAVVRAVRGALPPGFPVTMKVGAYDVPAGGLSPDGPLDFAAGLVAAGLDAVEVSCNLMTAYEDSIRRYIAVGRRQALGDALPHRLLAAPPPEAYLLPWARRLRPLVDVPIILAGGFRTVETMQAALEAGDVDFVAMARPLIREPDLPAQIAAGRTGQVACTSCNLCLHHKGPPGVRCWRTPKRRLAAYAYHWAARRLRRSR